MPADDRDALGNRPSASGGVRRLRRTERREQILAAATVAFVRFGGFRNTSLDDVAREAGVTRVILYRHFESKTDLYRAALDRAAARMRSAATIDGNLSESTVPGMLAWAADDQDGFRLLFDQSPREPEFRHEIHQLLAGMRAASHLALAATAASDAWARWGAHLATDLVVEAIGAWLDTGQPDRDEAADRILDVLGGVFDAVRPRA